MKKQDMEWVAKEGTIQTVALSRVKTDAGIIIKVPLYITFNVHPDIAEYIVQQHNERLKGAQA